MNPVEILAPAGSIEAMKAAYHAGADAVYIGGPKYGARAYAENPDLTGLLQAIDYAHLHHRKLYLTVNTLLKNEEIRGGLLDYMEPLYEEGLDAVLVQDIGVMELFHQNFPGLALHASTQMTVYKPDYGDFLKKMGVCRLVLPRELSVDEIRHMKEKTGLDIEVFIHGALCYCYSGQCLMSSMIGGRSGNRGRCAQPCRQPYSFCVRKSGEDRAKESVHSSGYLLSPKDICGLEAIPDLVDAGVDSLKIEGRMKSPEYAALTAYIYRKYTDLYLEKGRESFAVEEDDRRKLLEIFNRGGFSGGYYHQHNGADMMSTVRPNNSGFYIGKAVLSSQGRKRRCRVKLKVPVSEGDRILLPGDKTFTVKEDRPADQYMTVPYTGSETEFPLMRVKNERLLKDIDKRFGPDQELKEKISGSLQLRKGEPVRLTVGTDAYPGGRICCSCSKDTVQEARNRALTADELEKRMRRTGATPFEISHLTIEMDDNVFLPVSSLNELRREALGKMEQEILARFRRQKNPDFPDLGPMAGSKTEDGETVFAALITNAEQLVPLLDLPEIRVLYAEDVFLSQDELEDMAAKIKDSGKEFWIALPHVMREAAADYCRKRLDTWRRADGFLVRSMEGYLFLRENGLHQPVAGDYGIWCTNDASASVLRRELGRVTLSPELNRRELLGMEALSGNEFVIYGRQILMLSAQCLKKTAGCCDGVEQESTLTDRMHKQFPVRNVCRLCYNIIYNCVPLSLPMAKNDLSRTKGPGVLRIQFLDETPQQVKRIAQTLICGKEDMAEYTRGHYNRRVE